MAWLFRYIHPFYHCISLCLGIILGDIIILVFSPNPALPDLLILPILGLIITGFFLQQRYFLIIELILGVSLIFVRASPALADRHLLSRFFGQELIISGIISSDPKFSEFQTTISMSNLEIFQHKFAGQVLIQMPPRLKLRRSDRLTIRGKLEPSSGTFFVKIRRPKILKQTRASPPDLFLELRDWFANNVRSYLPDSTAGLGLGYLLGIRSSLSPDLNQLLRVVGLTHLVVASGTHLAIIINFARRFFGCFGKIIGLFFALVFLIIFFGIIGPTPSMTRAVLSSAASLLAGFFGRHFRPLPLIIFLMAATILINPEFPLNLGWQLSFAAYTGIVLFTPILIKWLFASSPGFLAKTLLSTVAAGLFCTPILLFSFGSTSLITILANLLILPTIPLAIALVFLTGSLWFCPVFARLVSGLANFLLEFHLLVINWLGSQPSFLIQTTPGSPFIFLFYLPLIIILITNYPTYQRNAIINL